MNKAAVLFDMDGVLVDSEPVIEAAARAGLKEFGVCAQPKDFLEFVGMGEDRYIGGVSEKYGVPYQLSMKKRVYEIYVEIVSEKLKVYAGIPDILEELAKEGRPLALASSADGIKIEANLGVAGIDPGLFQVITSGEDVIHKKPSPEIYLTTARRLGLDAAACIVVEDALSGVKAAKAAGMRCIAVTTSFGRQALLEAGADCIIEEIHQLMEGLNIIDAPFKP